MGGDSLALIFFPADTQQMLNVKKWPCMFLLKRILRREDDESLNIECWLVEISVPVTSIVVVALPAKARQCPLYQIQSIFEFTVLCIYKIALYHVETETRTSHLNFTVELLNQWHEQYILGEHNIFSTARSIRATVASVRKSDKGWRWTPSPVSCHRAWLFTPCHHHHHHCDHGHQYHAASPC